MILTAFSQPSAPRKGSTISPRHYWSVLGQRLLHRMTLSGAHICTHACCVYISADGSTRKNRRILRTNHPHKASA